MSRKHLKTEIIDAILDTKIIKIQLINAETIFNLSKLTNSEVSTWMLQHTLIGHKQGFQKFSGQCY